MAGAIGVHGVGVVDEGGRTDDHAAVGAVARRRPDADGDDEIGSSDGSAKVGQHACRLERARPRDDVFMSSSTHQTSTCAKGVPARTVSMTGGVVAGGLA